MRSGPLRHCFGSACAFVVLAFVLLGTLPVHAASLAIGGTPPAAITAGEQYDFTPFATIPDLGAHRFEIENKPAWATFDPVYGQLFGIPGPGQAGVYYDIRISVTVNGQRAALPPFSISVYAFSIGGHPDGAVRATEQYDFTPYAVVPARGSYWFEIENKPSWAEFNPAVGQLIGSPEPKDVGGYGPIRISLNVDGARVSLPAFSINVAPESSVTQQGDRSALLSWYPPTINTDGSPLRDLDGYIIYAGHAPDSLQPLLVLRNSQLAAFEITGLTPGLYYFAMATTTARGLQSNLSTPVAHWIN